MLNARGVVANYNSFEPLIVGISGPSTVNVGDQYTMTANVQNCSGSRTYRWERSENGFNYFQVGTSSSYSSIALPLFNGSNQLYIRLTVTCDGQTISRTRTLFIFDPSGGGGIFAQAALPELEEENVPSSVYPVPASSELNVHLASEIDQKVTVKLFGIEPFRYEKKLYSGKIKEGRNSLLFNVSNISQGIYELIVNGEKGVVFQKRILVSR